MSSVKTRLMGIQKRVRFKMVGKLDLNMLFKNFAAGRENRNGAVV